jgi:hypothetical protein
MKKILLILFYIFICAFASLVVFQLPSVIKGEPLFQDSEELVICLFAGTAAGLIVGFFSTGNNFQSKE